MQIFQKIFFIIFLTTSLYASQKTCILIIHSYSQEYPWTKNQHTSFVKTLQESGKNFDFHTEYLDTKRLKLTPEYQEKFLQYLKFKYKNSHLGLVYVTDDNALEFIYKNKNELFQAQKQPIVFFSGVNNLDMHKTLPKDSFAGVYEVKEIKPNIELIKQFSPQTRDIWFIGDDSSTYHSIKKELQTQHKDFANMHFHYISDEYISKVTKELPHNKRSFVLLTTIGNLKDDNNNTLQPKESIDIIKDNKNLIILSMEDAYMTKGVIGGYVTSGIKHGEEAAKLILQYLTTKSMKNISSLTNSPNIYMFNSKELTNSRIILSKYIARDSVIIGKDKDFIEKNKSILLDIFLILLFISTLTFIALYAIQRQKYMNQQQRFSELNNLDTKFQIQKQLLEHIFKLDDICYWKLNTANNEIFISDELINILGSDISLYKNDPYFLNYFVSLDDKALLSDNISYVKKSGKSVKFTHKIATSNKTLFNVKHIIFAQNDKVNENSIILGIIKIDK